jgi:hypothetical protein
MSLGIVFKSPEGIVLAVDSRVTLTAHLPNNASIPATYDNATKMLRVKGQDHVGVVTFGRGVLGRVEIRTAHSYLPELEAELAGEARLTVEDFARRLGAFFLGRWNASSMPAGADPMIFLVGGYDPDAVYGRVFEVVVPARPEPLEQNAGGSFGLTSGGQTEILQRILNGYDQNAVGAIQQALSFNDTQTAQLRQALAQQALSIPYPFLPLQDCVDLVLFLIQSTATLHTWLVGVRGVGGAIDVATITRTEGFRSVQSKTIRGV